MEKLTWDSNFWGIDFYDAKIGDSLNIDKTKDYIIQVLCDQNQIIEVNDNNQLKFIETKVSLKKEVTEIINIEYHMFKELNINDLEIHKQEFFNLFGKNSRYRMFPKRKVNEFYYIWLVNGINDKKDTSVVGYFIDNQLAGFVSFKIHSDFIQIGLIGVFNDFQRKGISHKLLSYVENQVLNHKLKTLRIATNTFNLPALNTYIKKGFIIDEIKYWFYIYNFDYNVD